MSRGAQNQLSRTRDLPNPNEYVQALLGEYSPWAFDEEKAPTLRGEWRQEFGAEADGALDLEIGTGNGFHFAWRAQQHPQRSLVGIELKYKPLIQTIRRARNNESENARMVRYNARLLRDLFADEELDNVFIHHPDPWPKKSQKKHRLIQPDFLEEMFALQKPGSFFEFKTDSDDYFDWAFRCSKRALMRSKVQPETCTSQTTPSKTSSPISKASSCEKASRFTMRLCGSVEGLGSSHKIVFFSADMLVIEVT
jgi:tRNA (guanine-N7-)-methyltransferase